MKPDVCKPAVGAFTSEVSAGYTPPKTHTHGQSSKFPPPSLAETLLEAAIEIELVAVVDPLANTLQRRASAHRLSDLIAQRSPAQVARMEAERGLR